MHMHTHTHMHMHAHSCTCTHTGVMLQSQTCTCIHKMALAGIHQTHTYTHPTGLCFVNLCLNYYIIFLLSLVAMCTFTCRCEPALQECTLMHTGMQAQTHTLTQTNTHTHTNERTHTHIHKCKPSTLVDTSLLGTPPALTQH